MKSLERAIVDAFLRDNPIRIDFSNGPLLKVDFRNLRETVCSTIENGPSEEEFQLIVMAIAKKNGCFSHPFPLGPEIFIIVRHLRDLRLGLRVDAKKIFENISIAQEEMYWFFAKLIADELIRGLREFDKDGLLLPALQEIKERDLCLVAGD